MTKTHLVRRAWDIIHAEGFINLTRKRLCRAVCLPTGSFQNVAKCTFVEFVEELRKRDRKPSTLRPCNVGRANSKSRKDHILRHALRLAERWGYDKITRADIADSAGISPSLVTYHFGSMDWLRRRVMVEAVEQKRVKVIAQGLVNGSWTAKHAPIGLRRQAAKLLSGV